MTQYERDAQGRLRYGKGNGQLSGTFAPDPQAQRTQADADTSRRLAQDTQTRVKETAAALSFAARGLKPSASQTRTYEDGTVGSETEYHGTMSNRQLVELYDDIQAQRKEDEHTRIILIDDEKEEWFKTHNHNEKPFPPDERRLNPFTDPSEYVVFDTETSGLDFDNRTGEPIDSALLEIGAVKYRDGKPVEEFHTMVSPGGKPVNWDGTGDGLYVPGFNGMTESEVEGAPSEREAAQLFDKWAGEGTVVMAHNAKFDMEMMDRALGGGATGDGSHPFRHQFIDTLEYARSQHHDVLLKVDDLIDTYHVDGGREKHRGLEDARQEAQLYERLKAERDGSRPLSVEDYVKARERREDSVCFGSGKRAEDDRDRRLGKQADWRRRVTVQVLSFAEPDRGAGGGE